MTGDEIFYAIGETVSTLEDLRIQLETMHKGRTVRYCGDRVFRVTKVAVDNWNGEAYVVLKGPVLKRDGNPHAKNEGSMRFENVEFVD